MRRIVKVTIFALAMLPGLAHAQALPPACEANRDIYQIEPEGIFPPDIYIENNSKVCFVNNSTYDNLILRYVNKNGDKTYTDPVDRTETTRQLVNAGAGDITPIQITRRIERIVEECGTEQYEDCRWTWSWRWGWRWTCTTRTRTKYCNRDIEIVEETPIPNMTKGRFLTDPLVLEY